MNFKRILTAAIGLPIIILVLIFGNKYIIDVIFAIVAIMAMREYAKAIEKEAKFTKFLGYILAGCIALVHIVPAEMLNYWVTLGVPILMLILFAIVVISDMKYNFKDMAFSFVGIVYVIAFVGFIPMIYGYNTGSISGKLLIWFVLAAAWGSDTFAYCFGMKFGKHKFSKVSPNKSIEGCVAGIFGAIAFSVLFSLLMNKYFETQISYLAISIISAILCVIGQLGDLSASSIKRYFEIKDFSNIFPGHGGMLDRIDSVMFISPFAYFLLTRFL